jgi:response regulator of citrate/malate metabolism
MTLFKLKQVTDYLIKPINRDKYASILNSFYSKTSITIFLMSRFKKIIRKRFSYWSSPEKTIQVNKKK